MDRLPPLGSIRAFEAAARHLSITRAADELSVTPGAVSRQIRQLEDALNVPLFIRGHRQITLTRHGADYFRAASKAIETLGDATRRLAKGRQPKQLKVRPSKPSPCAG